MRIARCQLVESAVWAVENLSVLSLLAVDDSVQRAVAAAQNNSVVFGNVLEYRALFQMENFYIKTSAKNGGEHIVVYSCDIARHIVYDYCALSHNINLSNPSNKSKIKRSINCIFRQKL